VHLLNSAKGYYLLFASLVASRIQVGSAHEAPLGREGETNRQPTAARRTALREAVAWAAAPSCQTRGSSRPLLLLLMLMLLMLIEEAPAVALVDGFR
jgi:hypothetical protein